MIVWGIGVILPVFFTDTLWTGHLSINSFLAYDNTGLPYNVSMIVNEDMELVESRYQAYSPVFLSAAVILRGGIVIATYFAVIIFAGLWHGKAIYSSIKRAFRREAQLHNFSDVHSRLMKSYEVPEVSSNKRAHAALVMACTLGLLGSARHCCWSWIHNDIFLANKCPRMQVSTAQASTKRILIRG